MYNEMNNNVIYNENNKYVNVKCIIMINEIINNDIMIK